MFGIRLISRRSYSTAPKRSWTPSKGPGAKPSPERARINRARNMEADKRKKNFMTRQASEIQTIPEIIKSRVGEPDSEEYLSRQAEYAKFITIFGRKTVRDALRDKELKFEHIHMDEKLIAVNSNVRRSEADPVILEILDLIRERRIALVPVDKIRVGIISKAGKQDGGIVADLVPPKGNKLSNSAEFLKTFPDGYRVLALDQITTPSNMGMIIRSAIASNAFDAILLGPGSVQSNNPLVIKASSGTALLPAKNSLETKSGLVYITASDSMFKSLTEFQNDGADIALLAVQKQPKKNWSTKHDPPSQRVEDLSISLWDYHPPKKTVFVIGGESQGHDPAVEQAATRRVHIPMYNQVESLNCAVTASLVAFSPHLRSKSGHKEL